MKLYLNFNGKFFIEDISLEDILIEALESEGIKIIKGNHKSDGTEADPESKPKEGPGN